MKRALLFLGLSVSVTLPAAAQVSPKSSANGQAVNAIVGEAAGCPYVVKLGVACALRHRGTLQGVYGFQSPITRHSPAAVWRDAERAWRESALRDITNGATHFGSLQDVRKGVFRGLRLTRVLGAGSAATYFFR